MKIDLKAIKPQKIRKPPRIILYGSPGVGKSTFAAHIPGALFLDVEGGTLNLEAARVEREALETFDDVADVLSALLTQEHEYSTLVIDTADFLEKVLMKQVAVEHGKKDFAQINGYGREYIALANVWRGICQTLDDLREKRGMAVILIAHETLRKIKEPDTETYEKYTLALDPRTTEFLEAWCDCILFAKEEVYAEKDKSQRVKTRAGDRMLFTKDCPHYLAKNRYGLPEEIPFSWEAFSAALAEAMKSPETAAA